MTQYNTLNEKLSNFQLDKLKSGIRNVTQVTLNLSKNIICNSNDSNSFSFKLLLTNAQVSSARKAVANASSANTKISKTQLSKLV